MVVIHIICLGSWPYKRSYERLYDRLLDFQSATEKLADAKIRGEIALLDYTEVRLRHTFVRVEMQLRKPGSYK